ncbi:hypothetical protein [Kosmotoga pacifica]|nr:hypothetical protein [Kosmotoga pacifica]
MHKIILLMIAIIVVSLFASLFIYSETRTVKIALIYGDLLEVSEAADAFMADNPVNLKLLKVRLDSGNMDEVFAELKEEGVKIIIGPSYSEEASAILPFLQKYDLYAISPTVTSAAVVGKDGRIITMSIPDRIQVKKLVDSMKQDGVTELFVFADNYNRTYVDPFIEMLIESFPGTVTSVRASNPEEININYLRSALNFSGVLFVAPGLLTGYVISKLEELGYNGHLYASDYALDKKLFLFDGELIRELKAFSHVAKPLCYKKTMDFVGTYNALIFVKELFQRYGHDLHTTFNKLDGFTFQGMDGFVELRGYYVNKDTSVIALKEMMTFGE